MSKHDQRRRRTESQTEVQENVYPMQVKKMTEQETKDYHIKKLCDISVKSLGQKPQLVEPTDEQKEWVLLTLKQPVEYWQRWFVGQYFTQEQKAAMRLTANDIAGRGIE